MTRPTEADESAPATRPSRSAAAVESTRAAPRRATGRVPATAKSTADRTRTDAEVLDEARLLTADWSDDRLTAERLRSELRIGQKPRPRPARPAAGRAHRPGRARRVRRLRGRASRRTRRSRLPATEATRHSPRRHGLTPQAHRSPHPVRLTPSPGLTSAGHRGPRTAKHPAPAPHGEPTHARPAPRTPHPPAGDVHHSSPRQPSKLEVRTLPRGGSARTRPRPGGGGPRPAPGGTGREGCDRGRTAAGKGRPSAPDQERGEARVRASKKQRPAQSVRLNDHEHAIIQAGADAVGMSQAGFLAHSALTAARDLTRTAAEIATEREVLDELFAMRRQLGWAGSNLNQVAKALNSGADAPHLKEVLADMHRAAQAAEKAVDRSRQPPEGCRRLDPQHPPAGQQHHRPPPLPLRHRHARGTHRPAPRRLLRRHGPRPRPRPLGHQEGPRSTSSTSPSTLLDADQRPEKHVWHCSVRAAPDDPILSDERVGRHRPPHRRRHRHRPRRRRGLPLGRRPPRRRPHPHHRHPRPRRRPPPRPPPLRQTRPGRMPAASKPTTASAASRPATAPPPSAPPAPNATRPNARAGSAPPARNCARPSAARWPAPTSEEEFFDRLAAAGLLDAHAGRALRRPARLQGRPARTTATGTRSRSSTLAPRSPPTCPCPASGNASPPKPPAPDTTDSERLGHAHSIFSACRGPARRYATRPCGRRCSSSSRRR